MTDTKASPAMELGTQEKRIANILLRFLNEVKEPMETISFLSRIVEEDEPDPNGWQRCDICGTFERFKKGRYLNCGPWACDSCTSREINFGMEDTE